MFYLILALIIGIGVPIQTAVNSRLRGIVLSPFVASFVSFTVGTIFLAVVTLITTHSLLIPMHTFQNSPWWLWIGGILGVVALTGNILLFPKLGGVQTVILPIMGQIFMSMLIDNFGWFGSPILAFSPLRAIGVLILIIGVIFVIVLPGYFSKQQPQTLGYQENKLPFQLFGIVAGMLMAAQSAINGHLGTVLHSPVHAAFVSFFVGMLCLFILVTFILRQLSNIKLAMNHTHPKWIWFGGILGSFFVLGMAYLVPIIGTGLVVVMGLFGQLTCSILIDKFGLFGAVRKNVTRIQIIGLLLMIIGVALIKLF